MTAFEVRPICQVAVAMVMTYDFKQTVDTLKPLKLKVLCHEKFLSFISHKSYQIYFCLQLSSSVASFVRKPAAHFEFRNYGGALHEAKIALVEIYTNLVIFSILGV